MVLHTTVESIIVEVIIIGTSVEDVDVVVVVVVPFEGFVDVGGSEEDVDSVSGTMTDSHGGGGV